MKKIQLLPSAMLALLTILCVSLFSFTTRLSLELFPCEMSAGGEGFEIYINNKLVLQQYGKEMNTVKSLELDQQVSNGQLAIRYYHCGRPGKSRTVTIKDEKGAMLKEWKFGDAKDAAEKICCNVKDIMALPKLKAGQKVKLYYSASELPEGRLLAEIRTGHVGNTNP
jgi:hypothetical protein